MEERPRLGSVLVIGDPTDADVKRLCEALKSLGHDVLDGHDPSLSFPPREPDLIVAIERPGERLRLSVSTSETRGEDEDWLECYEGILTRSPSMLRVLRSLESIETNDVSVLVEGETGTGKELVANAIHNRSERCKGPFVAVNLAAISDSLRESELFGHVRGAFTGAIEQRCGAIVEANHGTLFLDEVGDASPGLQASLLRVLEEGTITPVGSDRPRQVDVRIISAANRPLEELVREGRLRRDLYYRLNVFPIHLPPLRERPEDIFPLAKHFLRITTHAVGRRPPGISRNARTALEAHTWEGNVRELRNVMARAGIVSRGGLLVAADLPLRPSASAPSPAVIGVPSNRGTLESLEREIFSKTLAVANGNQSQAARILGLHESTFRFRLRKLGITARATGS